MSIAISYMQDEVLSFFAGVEEEFTLKTPDGFDLHGIYNRGREEKSGKLFVIAHGLGGYATEALHMMAMRYFVNKGYDVVRFFFYASPPKARKLFTCTLKDHVSDLNMVLAHFRKGYEKVFVAGHSYGGMTALLANPDVNAVSMWDSTLWPYETFWKNNAYYVPEYECYMLNYGYECRIGNQMVEESVSYDFERVKILAEEMTAPVQLLVADEAVRRKGQEKVFALFPQPSEFAVIAGAGHEYSEGDTVFDLLERTYSWFERF